MAATPVLRRNRNIVLEIPDPTGLMAICRFNHLHAPFDRPAVRRALLGNPRLGAEQIERVLRLDRDLGTDPLLHEGFVTPTAIITAPHLLENLWAVAGRDVHADVEGQGAVHADVHADLQAARTGGRANGSAPARTCGSRAGSGRVRRRRNHKWLHRATAIDAAIA